MVTLRDYQLEATDAVEQHWISGGTAALVDMATATGKSWVLAELMRRAIAADPHARLLLAVHVRELVEQDVDALLSIWPEAPYGICSEGRGRRVHDQQIILGTIQTLFRDAHLLGRRDLLLIYEVQLPLHQAGFEPRVVRNRHWKITWADRSARTRVLVVAFTPDDRWARVQSRATLRRLLAS